MAANMGRAMDPSLTFKPNRTGHNDVVLYFAEQEWICDSYYFALDNELLPDIESEEKVRLVLKRLLEQWLEAIRALKVGEVAYLPYDFSDQCTGWLRCTCKPRGYAIAHGWSGVEGWSFAPSAIGILIRELGDFRASGAERVMEADVLVAAIGSSLESLGPCSEPPV
jgi:hypothetical protein